MTEPRRPSDRPPTAGAGLAAPAPMDVVIGLEVHAQLLTRSKMFCGCPTAFGAAPNTQTCPVCQGMPGTLPVINRAAIEYAVRTALALNCRVNAGCRFARKHYYYPDMPKNFQISQYEETPAEDSPLEAQGATGAVHLAPQPAVLGQRFLVLADLEVLRHVGVVVVLAREAATRVDAAVERERGADGVLDRRAVDHG